MHLRLRQRVAGTERARAGAPLRLVVPGAVGARHVKWLHAVALRRGRSESPWQRTFYTHPDGTPLRAWPICSLVTRVDVLRHPGAGDADQRVVVAARGVAYAGAGAGVHAVEVSADGGATWRRAALRPPALPDARGWAWRLWDAELELPARELRLSPPPRDAAAAAGGTPANATVELWARAIDARGGVAQPLEPAEAIAAMPKGYLFNPVHRVRVAIDRATTRL